MTLVGSFAPIGAAISMIDEANCFDAMNANRKLHVLQHHLVIMHTACQRDDIEIIISKADRDPGLEKLLQSIIHAMYDQRIALDGSLIFSGNILLHYNTSPCSRFKNRPSPDLPNHISSSTISFPRRKTFSGIPVSSQPSYKL